MRGPRPAWAAAWPWAAAAAAASAASLAAAYRLGAARANGAAAAGGLPPTRPQRRLAFLLVVRLAFRSADERDAWVAVWRPLAAAVRGREPRTLAFELSVSDRDPLHVVVVERYASRDDYSNVHRATPAFAEFKKRSAALPFFESIAVEGDSYLETGIGFAF